MLILTLITIFQLIEGDKNVRADELHQRDIQHNVPTDLIPLSNVKSVQLRPAVCYLPQTHTQSSAKELDQFRQDENFYQPLVVGHATKRDMNQHLVHYYEEPPAIFSHRVVHTIPLWTTAKTLYNQYRKRRFVDLEATTPESESIEREVYPFDDQISDYSVKNLIVRKLRDVSKQRQRDAAATGAVVHDHQPTVDEMRYFHDIYMRLAGPHERNLFGHVEHGPHLFEKRFESQNGGNRFKGKVLWADKTGGYGEHHWDLAQGKLS